MSADTKQTASALRSALRKTFPGVPFSVRMARGTAYGWIDVSWTDGPTDEMVGQVTDRFESSRFSGMDDSYHATGNAQWSCCGVILHRTYSEEMVDRALALVREDDAAVGPYIHADGRVFVSPSPWGRSARDVALGYCRSVAA
jgi:hypothetical protein